MRFISGSLLVATVTLSATMLAVAQTGYSGQCGSGPFSGAYVGAHTGYMRLDSDQTVRPNFQNAGQRSSGSSDAWMGGLHSGYNWQCGAWVLGGLTDFSWTDAQSSVLSQGQVLKQEYDYVGRVNGKLGVAFGNFMIYGTGGFAYARVKREFDTGLGAGFSDRDIDTGWNAGGGLEWGLGQWLVRAEAYYVDFEDRQNSYLLSPGGRSRVSWDDELVVAKLGLSIKLHKEAPVIAETFK